MPGLPQLAFLLSIVGLSVSLAGFSGLVAAFKRGVPLRPVDAYRLRQIPEMALATGFIALITLALADTVGNASIAIRVAAVAGLLFTGAHIFVLARRARAMNMRLTGTNVVVAGVIDIAVIVAAVVSVIVGSAAAYEWLLALMIARPGLAFLLALTDVTVA